MIVVTKEQTLSTNRGWRHDEISVWPGDTGLGRFVYLLVCLFVVISLHWSTQLTYRRMSRLDCTSCERRKQGLMDSSDFALEKPESARVSQSEKIRFEDMSSPPP